MKQARKILQNPLRETMIELAIASSVSVLLRGKTGTGKTHLARQIHDRSARRSGPFVEVNLATLAESLIEAELFGCERGAFTGADRARKGRLELAHGGTLFLDEIGELPLHLQARLLDVIQFKRITPLGSSRAIRLDIRIIFATHCDLEALVAEKRFREDLLHRIRVIELELPALADRRDDFDELVHELLAEHAVQQQKQILRIDENVVSLFESYLWPGNLRELSHVLEFAVLACKGGEITAQDLPEWFRSASRKQLLAQIPSASEASVLAESGTSDVVRRTFLPHVIEGLFVSQASETPRAKTPSPGGPCEWNYGGIMDQFEREFLAAALAACNGQLSKTAKKMGLSRTTLFRRMRYHNLGKGTLPSESQCAVLDSKSEGSKNLSKNPLPGASSFCTYVLPAASLSPLKSSLDRGRERSAVFFEN